MKDRGYSVRAVSEFSSAEDSPGIQVGCEGLLGLKTGPRSLRGTVLRDGLGGKFMSDGSDQRIAAGDGTT